MGRAAATSQSVRTAASGAVFRALRYEVDRTPVLTDGNARYPNLLLGARRSTKGASSRGERGAPRGGKGGDTEEAEVGHKGEEQALLSRRKRAPDPRARHAGGVSSLSGQVRVVGGHRPIVRESRDGPEDAPVLRTSWPSTFARCLLATTVSVSVESPVWSFRAKKAPVLEDVPPRSRLVSSSVSVPLRLRFPLAWGSLDAFPSSALFACP